MAWNLLQSWLQMTEESEQKDANDESAPVAVKSQGSGKAARLVGGLVTHGLQFLLMVTAVLAGGMISARLGGSPGDDPAAVPEATAPAKTTAAAKPQKPKKAVVAPARYFALDPPLVVNLSENGTARYLQVNVEVMARDEKVIAAVQQNAPLIRNDLVQLLSDRAPEELMSREGREKMRAEAQSAVNRILEQEADGAQIESLLFTGFVVQ
jgi:flagellar FliL protein